MKNILIIFTLVLISNTAVALTNCKATYVTMGDSDKPSRVFYRCRTEDGVCYYIPKGFDSGPALSCFPMSK